ncbi:TonB-dependent receptor [Pseudomonas sp. CGJS7]|uniref:TonB-dependent receptor n=1 Tax=Pseudomonas sp. CGJS7 TaxID=3109348 RepID=UPI0030087271
MHPFIRVLAVAIVGALWIAPAGEAIGAEASGDGYRLAPGELDAALTAFALHYRLQIMYTPAQVAGLRTAGLSGAADARSGLAQLLSGSGLAAVAVSPGVFLLTPAPRPAAKTRVGKTPAGDRNPATTPFELDPIHVTGSRIGRAQLESALPTTVIDQEQIRASGYQTLFDVLRHLPGMAGHHPFDVATEQGASQVPVAAAASTSLYSLGPRATLFLVDGRRVASYGLVSSALGGLADLNGIPLSMVDRIEIVRGGASAIYGADAMAGVVNVILKKDYLGGEVGMSYGVSSHGDGETQRQSASWGVPIASRGQLHLGLERFDRSALLGRQRSWSSMNQRRYGGADHRVPFGFVENIDRAELVPACASIDDTTPGGMDCGFDSSRWTSLQPGLRSNALYAFYRHSLSAHTEFYAQVRNTRTELNMSAAPSHGVMQLPPDHPDATGPSFEPTGEHLLSYWFYDVGPVRNRIDTHAQDYAIGLRGSRPALEWTLDASFGRNRVGNRIDGLIGLDAIDKIIEKRSYRFNGIDRNSREVLDSLSPRIGLDGGMSIYALSGNVETDLFALASGSARMAAGFEARHEHAHSAPDSALINGNVALAHNFRASDLSRDIASVFAEIDMPLRKNLWANAAWRLDRSSGYEREASPMLGMRWQPWPALVLRSSFGKGFRAPALAELREPLIHPGSRGYALLPLSELPAPCRLPFERENRCLVWLGVRVNEQLRPETSSSRNFGLTWTPSRRLSVALDRYRIRRRNEILEVDPIASLADYPEALVKDKQGYVTGVDRYFDNIGSTEAGGWQLDVQSGFDSASWGSFTARLAGHYQDLLRRRQRRGETDADVLVAGVPKLALTGSLRWKRDDWTVTFNLRHSGSSTVLVPAKTATFLVETQIDQQRRVPSSTLSGIDVAYAGFRGWVLALNMDNIADRAPANADFNGRGYSVVDADVAGRYCTFSVQRQF